MASTDSNSWDDAIDDILNDNDDTSIHHHDLPQQANEPSAADMHDISLPLEPLPSAPSPVIMSTNGPASLFGVSVPSAPTPEPINPLASLFANSIFSSAPPVPLPSTTPAAPAAAAAAPTIFTASARNQTTESSRRSTILSISSLPSGITSAQENSGDAHLRFAEKPAPRTTGRARQAQISVSEQSEITAQLHQPAASAAGEATEDEIALPDFLSGIETRHAGGWSSVGRRRSIMDPPRESALDRLTPSTETQQPVLQPAPSVATNAAAASQGTLSINDPLGALLNLHRAPASHASTSKALEQQKQPTFGLATVQQPPSSLGSPLSTERRFPQPAVLTLPSHTSKRVEEFQKEIEAKQVQLAATSDALQTARSQTARLEHELEQAQANLKDSQEAQSTAAERILNLENCVDELKSKLDICNTTLCASQAEVTLLQSNSSAVANRAAELDAKELELQEQAKEVAAQRALVNARERETSKKLVELDQRATDLAAMESALASDQVLSRVMRQTIVQERVQLGHERDTVNMKRVELDERTQAFDVHIRHETTAIQQLKAKIEENDAKNRAETAIIRERMETTWAGHHATIEAERTALAQERTRLMREIDALGSKMREQQQEHDRAATTLQQERAAMDTSAASLVAREEALARMEARVAIRNQAAVMLEAKVAVAHKAALELQKLAQDGVEDARRTYEETAQEKRDIHTLTRNLDDKRNAERGGIDNEWQRVQAEWAKIEVERTRVMDQMRKVLSKSLVLEPTEQVVKTTLQSPLSGTPMIKQKYPLWKDRAQPLTSAYNGKTRKQSYGADGEFQAVLSHCKPSVQYVARYGIDTNAESTTSSVYTWDVSF